MAWSKVPHFLRRVNDGGDGAPVDLSDEIALLNARVLSDAVVLHALHDRTLKAPSRRVAMTWCVGERETQ